MRFAAASDHFWKFLKLAPTPASTCHVQRWECWLGLNFPCVNLCVFWWLFMQDWRLARKTYSKYLFKYPYSNYYHRVHLLPFLTTVSRRHTLVLNPVSFNYWYTIARQAQESGKKAGFDIHIFIWWSIGWFYFAL